MQFLDFEKPLEELYGQMSKLKDISAKNQADVSATLRELELSIEKTRANIYENLTPWQKVQLSRHPERPYTLYYIEKIFTDFTELFGDRQARDDKAIVGGIAMLEGNPVMVLGHQKGINTKMRQLRNFGMANPEGYRKALRLMKMAEKFGRPIITFIDTPGAFPGIDAEERGQAEAIARNLFEMVGLKVPVVCVIIGEGASGGALGIGVGDRVCMLEYTWYSVISPESCSSILWRSWNFKEKAAEQLKLTSADMSKFQLVDDVLKEPSGGAHTHPEKMADILKQYLINALSELSGFSPQERIQRRINKFCSMGFYNEAATEDFNTTTIQ
jgi:acetyl-CoA carboxylase carboxyl transferase subunit alpha